MGHNYRGAHGSCESCKKALFRSRKQAKQYIRQKHPGQSTLNAYYCPIGNGWHYGNLPPGGREQARRALEAKQRSKNNGSDNGAEDIKDPTG